MPIRKAEAEWQGSLREGRGELALESGAFRGPYTFKSRFEQGVETNPEELLGAAHAGCFTMALTTDAKQNCPVSRALAGVEITLDATLE